MENERKDWIEDVFDSVKGNQRASPDPALFARIKNNIESETKTIPIVGWRVAAAVLLLAVNLLVLNTYAQDWNSNTSKSDMQSSEQQLISNYNFYE